MTKRPHEKELPGERHYHGALAAASKTTVRSISAIAKITAAQIEITIATRARKLSLSIQSRMARSAEYPVCLINTGPPCSKTAFRAFKHTTRHAEARPQATLERDNAAAV